MKTQSKTSPKGGKKACLCDDGKYSKDCCTGELANQGIGATTGKSGVTITENNGVRTITRN